MVDVTRVEGGGHSGRGGNCSIFSFGVAGVSLSLVESRSLVRPLFMR